MGVGADETLRLGVLGVSLRDGRARAFIRAGTCVFVLAVSGWMIFIVEALSASSSRLTSQHYT